ncbi:hypothetical protein HYV84_00200 [Candidatus Woesearchaeota archaeon]|nr:hypothetical protein [Candidatus Woesearchaeota archaeon]
MCRYAEHKYKLPFACFKCRKSFKLDTETDYNTLHPFGRPNSGSSEKSGEIIAICPECGDRMNYMGHDFKAPKLSEIKQWKKVEILYKSGFGFDSCGCRGPGERPGKLWQVNDFLKKR